MMMDNSGFKQTRRVISVFSKLIVPILRKHERLLLFIISSTIISIYLKMDYVLLKI